MSELTKKIRKMEMVRMAYETKEAATKLLSLRDDGYLNLKEEEEDFLTNLIVESDQVIDGQDRISDDGVYMPPEEPDFEAMEADAAKRYDEQVEANEQFAEDMERRMFEMSQLQAKEARR